LGIEPKSMKVRVLFTSIFVFMALGSISQNLVPNYSFENIIQCPQNCNQFINYVSDWTGQGQNYGLFYFTAQCPGDTGAGSGATSLSGNVPYNYFYGFQYAHTGVSYAGICSFTSGGDTTYPYGSTKYANNRDYLEAPLLSSLNSGIKYYVVFFVNLQNASDYACSDMGAYFSNTYVPLNNSSLGQELPYNPQVANNPKKQELIDTLNWMKISGSFIAKGGEKYIVIGNFKNDSSSSIRYIDYSGQSGSAYYYVDDVIVSPDSAFVDSLATVSVQSINTPKEVMSVFPNPSNGKFAVEITNYELGIKNTVEVYNMLGQSIYKKQINSNTTEIDISNEPKGIYLYRVTNNEGEAIGSGKLVVQ